MSPCGDVEAALGEAERAAWEIRLEDAAGHLERVEQAFSCAVVEPSALARFFIAEAALELHGGNTEGATTRLRVARTLDLTGPDPSYGSKVRVLFESTSELEANATVSLEPVPVRDEVRIDTRRVTVPAQVSPGLHLVQVGPPGEVAFGEVVMVAPRSLMVVATHRDDAAPLVAPAPLPLPAPASPSPPPLVSGRRLSVPLLVTAGALAAAGGAAAAGSMVANRSIPEAGSLEAVDAAWRAQSALGWTAYGLWGGALVAAGAAFF